MRREWSIFAASRNSDRLRRNRPNNQLNKQEAMEKMMTTKGKLVTYTMPLEWAKILADMTSTEAFFDLTKGLPQEEAEAFAETLCCGAIPVAAPDSRPPADHFNEAISYSWNTLKSTLKGQITILDSELHKKMPGVEIRQGAIVEIAGEKYQAVQHGFSRWWFSPCANE